MDNRPSIVIQTFEQKIEQYEAEIIKLNQTKEQIQESLNKIRKELEDYKLSQKYKLGLIDEAKVESKTIMNSYEFKIYKKLIFCKKITDNFFIFSQVPLSAFIKNDIEAVFHTYGSLYVDFLLIPKDYNNPAKPFAVLEFYGSGHYGKDEKTKEKVQKRDEIKENLFKKIGLRYHILDYVDITNNKGWVDEDGKLKDCIAKLADELLK